jgi:hypothetical protein
MKTFSLKTRRNSFASVFARLIFYARENSATTTARRRKGLGRGKFHQRRNSSAAAAERKTKKKNYLWRIKKNYNIW